MNPVVLDGNQAGAVLDGEECALQAAVCAQLAEREHEAQVMREAVRLICR